MLERRDALEPEVHVGTDGRPAHRTVPMTTLPPRRSASDEHDTWRSQRANERSEPSDDPVAARSASDEAALGGVSERQASTRMPRPQPGTRRGTLATSRIPARNQRAKRALRSTRSIRPDRGDGKRERRPHLAESASEASARSRATNPAAAREARATSRTWRSQRAKRALGAERQPGRGEGSASDEPHLAESASEASARSKPSDNPVAARAPTS